MRKTILISIIFVLFAAPVFGQSQDPLRKLSRGLVNFSWGLVEIPRQMIKAEKETNEVGGFFIGLFKGTVYTVGRSFIGIYEIAAFLIPSYRPVVKPEFIFFDEE